MSLSSSSLSSTASESKYDVFISLKGCGKAYLKRKLRNAGITAFVVDEEKWFSVHEHTKVSRIVMALITREFVESKKCLETLQVRIKWSNKNKNLLLVFCGVSRLQLLWKMLALYPTHGFEGDDKKMLVVFPSFDFTGVDYSPWI